MGRRRQQNAAASSGRGGAGVSDMHLQTSYEDMKEGVGKQGRGETGNRTLTIKDTEANAESKFPDNRISNTKYEWWSFLPKLLWDQFRWVSVCMCVCVFV